jgi:hypothetical protein
VAAGEFNKGYLEAKKERMDHLLDGSWCYWNHDGEPGQPSAAAFSKGGMGLPEGGFATTTGEMVRPRAGSGNGGSSNGSSTSSMDMQ